jgi:hypothetical protein
MEFRLNLSYRFIKKSQNEFSRILQVGRRMGVCKQKTERGAFLPITWWVVFATIIFLLGLGQSLWPYEGTLIHRKAVIVNIVRPLAANESLKHKKVIDKALRLFLEKEGLEVITSPKLESLPIEPEDESSANMVTPNYTDLLAMARSLPADFLLLSMYSVSDQELELIFVLYDIEEGIPCATIKQAKPVDFTLDQGLGEAVDELLLSIQYKLTRYSPLPTASPVESILSTDAPGFKPPSRLLEPLIAEPKRFQIAAGVAPFLPVGRASDYFKIGLCTAVHGSYRFDVGTVQMNAGLFTGTYLFQAEGLSGTAGTLLLSIGPLVGITHGFDSAIDLYIHLSGGMTVMSITPSGLDNPLSKLLPFALAAAGFHLGLTSKLGLIAETNLVAFFETADGELSPLLGFTPVVYFRLRF